MTDTVITFSLLFLSPLFLTGVEGRYCYYYRYCYLTGGTVAGIAVSLTVFIGISVAIIVRFCIHASKRRRGTVIPRNQAAVNTTTTSNVYPMHGYAQPPPPYMQSQPAYWPAPANPVYPPPSNPGPVYPPNSLPPPPTYNNLAGPNKN